MSSATAMTHRHADVIVEETISGLPSNSLTPGGDLGSVRARCRAALRRTRLSVERGATAVEYALMVGLISVGIVTAVTALKEKTVDSLSRTAASTSGLIFDEAVSAGSTVSVKYIRNDLGVNGFAMISTKGGLAPATGSTSAILTKTAGDTQYVANITAPTAPGIYEVQIRKSDTAPNVVLEFGRLRVE